MVMGMQAGVIPRGVRVEFEFANQTGFDQGMQCVVDSGAGCAGVTFVDGRPQFFDRCVVGMLQQVVEHGNALRSPPQSRGAKSFIDWIGILQNWNQSGIRLSPM